MMRTLKSSEAFYIQRSSVFPSVATAWKASNQGQFDLLLSEFACN